MQKKSNMETCLHCVSVSAGDIADIMQFPLCFIGGLDMCQVHAWADAGEQESQSSWAEILISVI